MNINNKNGFSLLSMIFFMFLIAIVGIYGFQIGTGYLDQQTIKGAVNAALLEARSNENMNAKNIKNSIAKKVSVNTIDLPDENIVVTKVSNNYEVEVEFIKEIKITETIKLVMDLSVNEITPR